MGDDAMNLRRMFAGLLGAALVAGCTGGPGAGGPVPEDSARAAAMRASREREAEDARMRAAIAARPIETPKPAAQETEEQRAARMAEEAKRAREAEAARVAREAEEAKRREEESKIKTKADREAKEAEAARKKAEEEKQAAETAENAKLQAEERKKRRDAEIPRLREQIDKRVKELEDSNKNLVDLDKAKVDLGEQMKSEMSAKEKEGQAAVAAAQAVVTAKEALASKAHDVQNKRQTEYNDVLARYNVAVQNKTDITALSSERSTKLSALTQAQNDSSQKDREVRDARAKISQIQRETAQAVERLRVQFNMKIEQTNSSWISEKSRMRSKESDLAAMKLNLERLEKDAAGGN
jgi:hypothetical protein